MRERKYHIPLLGILLSIHLSSSYSFLLVSGSRSLNRRRIGMTIQHQRHGSSDEKKEKWTTLGSIATIQTPWMTVLGERLLDREGRELEYWRVEKDDSAVILVLHMNELLFPRSTYRPGVGHTTLDFPGGRLSRNVENPLDTVYSILERELNIPPESIGSIESLNEVGWDINSSFNNQRLFGFIAVVKDQVEFDESLVRFGTNTTEIDRLLSDLRCLQCRAVLLEWLIRRDRTSSTVT